MKINRPASFAALAFAGALALTACSSSSSTSSDGGNTDGPTIAGAACESGSLKASGSSAQANAMSTWISDYQTACEGATIDYQPTGSGAGVTDFINKQVAFAGSDSSLKAGDETTKADARCATGPALNIPMVGGAIALAYNVSGVDSLTLTPDIMAGIFSNTITKWNDPKIAAANTGATLPDASIAAFHRSDSSGTTDNFTKYLAATAPTAWTFGNDKVWKAQGGQAAKGNDGIGSALKATPNSIGYVELAFAQQNSLTTALVDNGGGAVEATSANRGVEHRLGTDHGHGKQPAAHDRLHREDARGLPDRPGDLRDRLRVGQRRRYPRAAQGLPDLHVERRRPV